MPRRTGVIGAVGQEFLSVISDRDFPFMLLICSMLPLRFVTLVTAIAIEEGKNQQESPVQPRSASPLPITSTGNGFSVVPFPMPVTPVFFSTQGRHPLECRGFGQSDVANNSSSMRLQPVPVLHMSCSSTMVQQPPIELLPMWLRLSLSSGQDQPSTSGGSAFQMRRNGDSSISVA